MTRRDIQGVVQRLSLCTYVLEASIPGAHRTTLTLRVPARSRLSCHCLPMHAIVHLIDNKVLPEVRWAGTRGGS